MQWRAGRIPFIARSHFDQAPLEIGQIRPQHGLAGLDAAATAIRAALDGHVDAVVAAPQTEYPRRTPHHTLKRLGIANPKIAISGLNPHEAKRACSATKK